MDRSLRSVFYFLLAVFLVGCGVGNNGGSSSNVTTPILEKGSAPSPVPGDPDYIDPTNALGFYSNGSLAEARTLPNTATGLLKIFRLRERAFATDTLIRTIEIAASAVHSTFPFGERLQVADISDRSGGYLSGHASHQNGLDADAIYLRTNFFEEYPDTNGPRGFTESFVQGNRVTTNFDVARNWALFKYLVSRGTVNRIFVDPAIKKVLCEKSTLIDPTVTPALRTETLRRLRPYGNHDDHFHLRINCPPNHTKCQPQSAPPAGSGCAEINAQSESLFSAEDELGPDEL